MDRGARQQRPLERTAASGHHPRMTDAQKPHQRLEYQASIDRPKLSLPNGKRVAVFLVVNIERWDIDRTMPRQVLTAPQGASVIPDVPNWAWHEYGMRVGFWRLKEALDLHGIAPTLAINGVVPSAYPQVTKACRDAGWEFHDPRRHRHVARSGRP